MKTANANVKTPRRSLRLTCPQCEGRDLHYLEAAGKLFCKQCEIVAWIFTDDGATRTDQLDLVAIAPGEFSSTGKRLIGNGFPPKQPEPIPDAIKGDPWWKGGER